VGFASARAAWLALRTQSFRANKGLGYGIAVPFGRNNMEPINWFMSVVTQHYFDFNGRARRAEFWWFVLVVIIIDIILGVIQSVLHLGSILTGLLSLGLLLPNLGVAVRRLHDIGRSGWWILIGLVPILGWILLIYWYAQPGTPGTNEYGPNPKGV
jgi:uncharacterized membrane protein YhaH (DUF805 family)